MDTKKSNKKKNIKNTKNNKSNNNFNNKSNINIPNTILKSRIFIISGVIFLLIVLLIARIAYLQLIDGENLQTSARSRQILTETISAKRGKILDANGQELALSYDTDKVYLNPEEIKNDSDKILVANGLASIFNLNETELLENIRTSKKMILIASKVEKNQIDSLKYWISNQKFKTGVSIESSTTRSYPYKNLASTILGFVDSNNKGSYGIELSWNSFLSGIAGKSISLKDASQSEIANSEQSYIAAENGYDLTLTIDANIQNIVETHLAAAVEEYKCKSGMTIAMDPSTGKLLAVADYPNFDCNNKNIPNSHLAKDWENLSSADKNEALLRMWTPKAITDTYEPGSVFKIITSAIAIEENIMQPDIPNTFDCHGNYVVPGEKRPIYCHKKSGHGKESLRNALENSCNPAFVELGLKIGKDLSYKYYDAFGFFNKTGISIAGEPKSGIFYPIETINDHELGTMSFGQRFTITPLQMITAAAAIANDGVLVQPQIVSSITNIDTNEITKFQTKEIRQVISKQTADTVASMMESVVNNGTGLRVKKDIPGMEQYSIGGKTGTSEPINGSSDGYIASYLAISPVENTKIVLLVILDTPGEGVNHNGGQIAAPTAGKMLQEILPYMGVETGNKDNLNNSHLTENDLY